MSIHRPIVPAFSLLLIIALAACQQGPEGSAASTSRVASPIGWSEESHTTKGRPNYTKVFPRNQVKRLDITIADADWKALQKDLRELASALDREGPGATTEPLGREPLHIPCTVEFDGQTWSHVALFASRGSALFTTLRSGVRKLPFGLHFDELADRYADVKDQRFYGFRALSLGNQVNDSSFLRQRAAQEILRDQNVPSPYAAFYRIYVDVGHGSTYFGLYTAVEVPDLPFLDGRFGSTDGNLYRAKGGGATFRYFAESSFVKETNRSARDWSDIESAIEALHADRSAAATWRAGLESWIDVDGFLNWLAVNTVIENEDAYGRTAHNYFLYADSKERGRLKWIPGDNSQALRTGSIGSMSLALREVGPEWPLIRYLMDDPVYRDTYYVYVEAVAAASFSRAAMEPWYRNMHELIAPYVVGPLGEISGYTFLRDARDFDRSINDLIDHLNRRQAAVKRALAAR